MRALRAKGFVAWHRWAGETSTTNENEIHGIDPAVPYIENAIGLTSQINAFLRGGAGGNGYKKINPGEPYYQTYQLFTITDEQKSPVKDRIYMWGDPLTILEEDTREAGRSATGGLLYDSYPTIKRAPAPEVSND